MTSREPAGSRRTHASRARMEPERVGAGTNRSRQWFDIMEAEGPSMTDAELRKAILAGGYDCRGF